MTDWLKLMLEEIRRKQREREQALGERRRREEKPEHGAGEAPGQLPGEPRGRP